jgi:hypothetical protein
MPVARASVLKLTVANGEVFSGDVSDRFVPSPLFHFLPAKPPGK